MSCHNETKLRTTSQTLYHDSLLHEKPMVFFTPYSSTNSEIRVSAISLLEPQLHNETKKVVNVCNQFPYERRCSSVSINKRFAKVWA